MAKKKYSMDLNTANDILQNVFAAGDVAPNTIPFDKLVLRGMAQTTLVKCCMSVAIGMLVLVLLAPLAFRSSDFKVTDKSALKVFEIMDHTLYQSEFMLTIKGSNIDYKGIYAKKIDESIVFPLRVRFVNGDTEVTFPYDGDALNLYIPDQNGNVLHAVLSER